MERPQSKIAVTEGGNDMANTIDIIYVLAIGDHLGIIDTGNPPPPVDEDLPSNGKNFPVLAVHHQHANVWIIRVA